MSQIICLFILILLSKGIGPRITLMSTPTTEVANSMEPSTSSGLTDGINYMRINDAGSTNNEPPKTRDTIMAQTVANQNSANEEPLPPGWEVRVDPYGI